MRMFLIRLRQTPRNRSVSNRTSCDLTNIRVVDVICRATDHKYCRGYISFISHLRDS